MSTPQPSSDPMTDPEIRNQVEARIRQLEYQQVVSQAIRNVSQSAQAAPTEEAINARRQIMLGILNLQLQVHDLAARETLKEGLAKTEALSVPERMEVFGRMTLTYTRLNDMALESYREAVEKVNQASWEDLTKMAAQATAHRAELEVMIRQFQEEDHQEADSEATSL